MRLLDSPEKQKAATQKYRLAHPEKVKARTLRWRAANRDKVRSAMARWWDAHREYKSVADHWYAVYMSRDKKKVTYKGMPFFDEWNPKTGSSFTAGAQWIIDNLGRRPDKTYHLHIVDRAVGFVPGNLQWVSRSRHKQSELIARLMLENRNLRVMRGVEG